MTFKNRFPLILFLVVGCLITVPAALHFAKQQHTPDVLNLISMTESDDIESFLQISSKQAGLKMMIKPALPGQWQIMIKESPEDALNHWLEHLAAEGVSVQSIQVLNTGKAGIVRVPSLTLIASPKLHQPFKFAR